MPAPYDPYLYSLVHRGNPGDLAFYSRIAEAREVLELGCGAGRVLSAMRGKARRVVGLEIDSAFAQEARRAVEDVDVHEGDMSSFELNERFDVIVAPYSAMYCLAGDRELSACLARVSEHLRPGGLFAFDVWGADGFHLHSDEEIYPHGEFEPLATVVDDGKRFEISEASVWNRAAQQVRARYRYEWDGNIEEAQLTHHYRLAQQLRDGLRAAGFEVASMTGGFQEGRYREDDPLLVVKARFPG